jgi:hypothetical protein
MVESTKKLNKIRRSRGRPKTLESSVFIGFRVPEQLFETISAWGERQVPRIGRSEAARRLIEAGLGLKGRGRG